MNKQYLSTEQAIIKTMETEEGRLNAFLCYYEYDVEKAYLRFYNSEEWEAMRGFLFLYQPPNNFVLDLGSGNGITSYAFIKSGYSVVSLEPDKSNLTGYGAMKNFKNSDSFPFCNVSGMGEFLPFKQKTFGLVFCRQVLHHAIDLQIMMNEISRVLVPGGILFATREHVVDNQQSLEQFLDLHPLHRYTKNEFAYPISDYINKLKYSGFRLEKIILSWDSVLNHYPTSNEELKRIISKKINKKFKPLGYQIPYTKIMEKFFRKRMSKKELEPGRLISFIAKVN